MTACKEKYGYSIEMNWICRIHSLSHLKSGTSLEGELINHDDDSLNENNKYTGTSEDGVITRGMIPKVQGCLDALATVPCIYILDGREPHTLLQGLFTRQGAGNHDSAIEMEEE
jgi:hypothetical protein